MQSGIFVHSAKNRRQRRRESAVISVVVFASLLAFAQANGAGTTQERAASTRACAGASRMNQRINLSSGVYTERAVAASPLYLDVPVGSDGQFYEECLRRDGFAQRDRVTAEFDRVAACNDPAIRNVLLTRRSPQNVRIASKIDAPAYARCVDAGITVEAEVEPASE